MPGQVAAATCEVEQPGVPGIGQRPRIGSLAPGLVQFKEPVHFRAQGGLEDRLLALEDPEQASPVLEQAEVCVLPLLPDPAEPL